MRQRPSLFQVQCRIQWLCVIADRLLGEADLANLQAASAGYRSALLGLPAPAAQALRSLRLFGACFASEAHLRAAYYDCAAWEEAHADEADYLEPPYAISQRGRSFLWRRRVPAHAPILAEMLDALQEPPLRSVILRPAAADHPAVISPRAEDLAPLSLPPFSFTPPPAPIHDHTRLPNPGLTVTFDELLATARRFDAVDEANPCDAPGNWVARLQEADGRRKFELLGRGLEGLQPIDTVRLCGVRHMIGLPGTGKSTLITLLIATLAERGARIAVLLPSIESCLSWLGLLQRYGVAPGLLVGQSATTRLEHARKLAERLAAGDDRGGLGDTAPGAALLGTTCALGGFVDDPEFPHLDPPCERLRQADEDGREGPRGCPLASVCGRLKGPRELVEAQVWLGHVLSTDTRVRRAFASVDLRYFELIASTFDLVIVDEADGAQAALDGKSVGTLDLTGSDVSYEMRLYEELLMPRAAGLNHMIGANIRNYANFAHDLAKLNATLVALLQADRRANGERGLAGRFADILVTGNAVLSRLFLPAEFASDAEREAGERRFDAIRALWDGCLGSALRARSDADGDHLDVDPVRLAPALGKTPEEVHAAAEAFTAAARDWLAAVLVSERDACLTAMRDALFPVVAPIPQAAEANELFRFAVAVTAVIMQFVAIAPLQDAMIAEGVHREPLFRAGISDDLARFLPEALVGRLSGLRYSFEGDPGRERLTIGYLTFRGAARALLYRLPELAGQKHGPAVLLASATSFLEESPTFHIPVGPDVVLKREDPLSAWRDSIYRFTPLDDPDLPGTKLRFSGAALHERDRILRRMLDAFYAGPRPRVRLMTEDFDAPRKVAFVVNSYAQVQMLKDHLRKTYPLLARRTIGVCRTVPAGAEGDWVTAAQVESLGGREDWDAVIFPMKALARGVNIVFVDGPRMRDAALGTVAFLTRPHPAAESLDLILGLVGRESLDYDQALLPSPVPADVQAEWRDRRSELLEKVRRLMRFRRSASTLGPLAEPFTADVMVDVLQTIGRAMRNGCKCRVLFVDAAWAPRSAAGGADTPTSSMLAAMLTILRRRCTDADPVRRDVYRALYEPFLHPLSHCVGLNFNLDFP